MLNVPELEQRWKRYKRSKRIPYYVAGGVSVVVAAIVGIYFFTPVQQKQQQTTLHTTASAQKVDLERDVIKSAASSTSVAAVPETQPVGVSSTSPAAVSSVTTEVKTPSHQLVSPQAQPSAPIAKQQTEVAPAKQTVRLAPSMSFMHDFESDVMQYYFKEPAASASEQPAPSSAPSSAPIHATALPSISSQSSSASTSTQSVYPAPKVREQHSSSVSKKMLIQRENDMKDIQDVVARFKKNKNPALSLFVAKRYYRIGNYQQAYNYALITNELDSNIEDSWLIFAKSLYKLDQKEMAIKTLKTYYEESGSVKAKITIDQMEKGSLQ